MRSEILPSLFGGHQEFLLDNLRWRWSFGHEGKLEGTNETSSSIIGGGEGSSPVFRFFPRWALAYNP